MAKEFAGVPKPGKKYGAKRPTRDEFILEEISEQLRDANAENAEVKLTVFGWDETVRGRVKEFDTRTGTIHMQRYGDITKVPFMDIMKVESPGV